MTESPRPPSLVGLPPPPSLPLSFCLPSVHLSAVRPLSIATGQFLVWWGYDVCPVHTQPTVVKTVCPEMQWLNAPKMTFEFLLMLQIVTRPSRDGM